MARALVHQDGSLTHARREIVNLMAARATQLSALAEKYWTIHGSGSIGDKAQQLMEKAWAIERAGCVLTPRIVFAMDFYNYYKEKKTFSSEDLKAIREVVQRFAGIPLLVRSSAHGDSRGTGIYESIFVLNNGSEEENIAALAEAMKTVLASEFSEDAIAFQRDMGLSEGMAVIVEPVPGPFFMTPSNKKPVYGPFYGGIAYSSTSYGPGFLRYAAGIPTKVVLGEGFRVEDGTSIDMKWSERTYLSSHNDPGIIPDPSFPHFFEYLKMRGRWCDGVWCCDKQGPEELLESYPLRISYEWTQEFFPDVDSAWVFQKLKNLERLIGRPQYVEWAIIDVSGKPELMILQISDVNLKTDFFEFSDTASTIVRSEYVVGSGKVFCNSIVYVYNRDGVELLSEYNLSHDDYLVIYNGALISLACSARPPLRYHHISNARVLVEHFRIAHDFDPENHFGGAIRDTGKILMVSNQIYLDILKHNRTSIMRQGERVSNYFGPAIKTPFTAELVVYPVKVRVIASERQRKAVVEIVE